MRKSVLSLLTILVTLTVCKAPLQAMSVYERADKLEKLALKEFRKLTPADRYFYRAVAYGKAVDFTSVGASSDLATAEDWGPERTLDAKRIEWLCSSDEARLLVPHVGISVVGARITGMLDLQFAHIAFPVFLLECYMPDGLNIESAELRELSLSGSHVGTFYAEGVRVEHNLILSYEFTATEEVRLTGARIGGNLNASGGYFVNPGPDTLFAENVDIAGDVLFRYGFRSEGRIDLNGAKIGGTLDCEGGCFINPDNVALQAEGISIRGDVFLRDGFETQGEIRLTGGRIGGRFDCASGLFQNLAGTVLNGEGLVVGSDLYLRQDFRAEGTIDLIGAKVEGNLDCDGAQLINPSGVAFTAKRLTVNGDAFFGNGSADTFQVKGSVLLESAKIDGTFTWGSNASPEGFSLNLRFAKMGRLWFEPEGWPGKNHLALDGLVYDGFYNPKNADVPTLIDWLRRQSDDRFLPQPYEQLAGVLRQSGHEDAAYSVLIAKEEDRGTDLSKSGLMIHNLMGLTIGYGYDPWRALWIGLSIVGIGTLIFEIGSRSGLIAATKEVEHVYEYPNATTKLSKDYPRFNSLVYSLDMFVPLLDLHQGNYWIPSAERGRSWFSTGIASGSLLKLYLGFHIYLGWALTTLLAVGLSGLVRS